MRENEGDEGDEGNEGNGGTGERSLLKKLRKTFIWDGLGYSLCKSVCASILFRPFPEKIVRERLTGSSAFYGERVRSLVRGIRPLLEAAAGYSFYRTCPA